MRYTPLRFVCSVALKLDSSAVSLPSGKILDVSVRPVYYGNSKIVDAMVLVRRYFSFDGC